MVKISIYSNKKSNENFNKSSKMNKTKVLILLLLPTADLTHKLHNTRSKVPCKLETLNYSIISSRKCSQMQKMTIHFKAHNVTYFTQKARFSSKEKT